MDETAEFVTMLDDLAAMVDNCEKSAEWKMDVLMKINELEDLICSLDT